LESTLLTNLDKGRPDALRLLWAKELSLSSRLRRQQRSDPEKISRYMPSRLPAQEPADRSLLEEAAHLGWMTLRESAPEGEAARILSRALHPIQDSASAGCAEISHGLQQNRVCNPLQIITICCYCRNHCSPPGHGGHQMGDLLRALREQANIQLGTLL